MGLSRRGRDASTRRQSNDSIELEVKTAAWTLRAPYASESTGEEGSYCADLVIGPAYQGEPGLLLHHEGKEAYIWNSEDPLRWLLVLPCPVIKAKGKLQPNPGRTTNNLNSWGIKVWVTVPDEETGPAEILEEGKGNTEWIVGDGYEYQLLPHGQLQIWGLS